MIMLKDMRRWAPDHVTGQMNDQILELLGLSRAVRERGADRIQLAHVDPNVATKTCTHFTKRNSYHNTEDRVSFWMDYLDL
jgi:hypothetical protein